MMNDGLEDLLPCTMDSPITSSQDESTSKFQLSQTFGLEDSCSNYLDADGYVFHSKLLTVFF